MGKVYKQHKNKLRGGRKKELPDHGACFFKGCPELAVRTFHCRTCEALEAQGECKSVVRVSHCLQHADEAAAAIKKHAIVGHPLPNVPRAILAGLKGEL